MDAGSTITPFTLSGVKSTDGITVDETNKTVTLTAANLNNQDVTFSANNGNYTFALANGISAPTTSGEGKFESLTYKSGGGYRYQAIHFLPTKKQSTTLNKATS